MLAWTSWLKSSNSGNAAGKLSLKIRSAASPETGFTQPRYFLLYIRIFPFFPLRRPSRNPACSFLSRGPPCRQLRPTRRRSFIGGLMSALGCVILTRMGRWRKSISYARYSILRTRPSPGLPPESHFESHYCGLQLSVLVITSQSLKKRLVLANIPL